MGYPTPQQILDAGGEILHYTSKAEFEKDGGRTADYLARGDRYIVTASPTSYPDEPDIEGPIHAMDLFWALFDDGGWTVMVWDKVEREGWAYQYVGPGWTEYIPGSDGVEGSLVKTAAPTTDANLLSRVNQYRAQRGVKPLQPGEWSEADLEEFAENIPTRNPGRRRGRASSSLKRKLMGGGG